MKKFIFIFLCLISLFGLTSCNASYEENKFFSEEVLNQAQINDQIKANISDFGLEVLKLIKEFPGIKVPEIVEKLQMKDLIANADKVRNEIKRNLFNYIEYKGSNKIGGYYLK